MRLNRVKDVERVSYYHCICRCVGLDRLLEVPRDKDVLREMLSQAADFSGVQVITYCIMDDHFHLLVRVPPRDAAITEEELVLRYRSLYRSTPLKVLEFTNRLKERGIRRDLMVTADPQTEALIARLKVRMHDISEFMKTFKQRFTQWYNKTHARVGTLWTERFKSLIVEDNPHLLSTLAAYIEMNPVRAGLCEQAQEHRWCGIRDFLERKGIYSTLRIVENNTLEEEALACKRLSYGYWFYREYILPMVEEAQEQLPVGREKELEVARAVLYCGRRETLKAMRLPMKQLLKGRLLHLSNGVILGSAVFLQAIASLGNGMRFGGFSPLMTGIQVDEELLLLCLRHIRGPKI